MSNPSFTSGPITYDVAEDVNKFRFVEVTEAGVKHATAVGPVHGAVAENGNADPEDNISLDSVKAARVGVRMAPETLPIEVVTGAEFVQGAAVFAGADGKAAATGTLQVGFAVRGSSRGLVSVRLDAPVFPSA